MDLLAQINKDKLPRHVAIIMDGNGRWAKQKGKPRVFGHKSGVLTVRTITETAAQLGIEYLTLYTFSTENWSRPSFEVEALMLLLVDTVNKEIKTLQDNNIRLSTIGDLSRLPSATYKALKKGIENTSSNTGLNLVLALNYSARWEILNAVKNLAHQAAKGELNPNDINESLFEAELSTKGIPDPELLIRTSGENRISNFLLWQIAYSELYFTPVFWPEFNADHFYDAILSYQNRERRFGKISEQL